MKELDEISWLDDVDKTTLRPIYDFQRENENKFEIDSRRSLALLPLWLTKKMGESQPEVLLTLADDELYDKIPMFVARSRLYFQMRDQWVAWINEGTSKEYVSLSNQFHWLAPLYVQELEGPLRYNLSVYIDLIKEEIDNDGNWHRVFYRKSGNENYITNIIDQAIDQAERIDNEIGSSYHSTSLKLLNQDRSMYEYLDNVDSGEEQPRLKDLRNSIAHSDYHMKYKDERVLVVFSNERDEWSIDLRKMLNVIGQHMLMMHALSTGIGISMFWVGNYVGEWDQAFSVIDSYSEGYPVAPGEGLAEKFEDISEDSRQKRDFIYPIDN